MNDPIRREPGRRMHGPRPIAVEVRRGGTGARPCEPCSWRSRFSLPGSSSRGWVPGVEQLAAGGEVLVVRWGWLAASCARWPPATARQDGSGGSMVRDLGGPALPAREAVRIYLVANLGRYVPGKLWQIAGLALLARARGVSAPVTTGAAVMGQAVALAGATLIGLPTIRVANPAADGRGGVAHRDRGLVIAGVGVPRVFRPLIRFWLRRVPGDAPLDITASAFGGLRWLILYTLNWAGYALAFWLLMRGLSLPGGVLVVGPASRRRTCSGT